MSAILEVRDLRKAYAGVSALDGVSFAVEAGSITGMIGPNGSGKSTAIDCISGFQKLDGGRVVLAGADITGRAPHVIARAGLMRTFQTVRIYERLSLRDNLAIATQQFDPATWIDELLRTRRYREAVAAGNSRARELVALIGLERYWDIETGILSYGQKKLVALAAALMPRPRIIVLDEPVAGVNPTRIREIEEALAALNRAGETFLIVEHNVEFITTLCHQVIVLEQGRKLAEGSGAEIHADSRVLEAYLGTTPEIAAAEIEGDGMSAPALELVGITAGYGSNPIVRDFTARLQAGSITTLIGGNGAGKSTLLRAIYGTNRHFAGQIVFKGETIEALAPWERLARGVGFVPQGRCNFPAMSVGENLKMGCYTLPARKHEAAIQRVSALFPVLSAKARIEAGNLSGGEQQILEMAMVLLLEPSLLLLDEPSLGLSPKMQGDVFATVQQIAATGVTVLVVEQNVRGALLISDRTLVMEQGRLFMEGPAAEVRTDPRIRQAYLGGNVKQAAH